MERGSWRGGGSNVRWHTTCWFVSEQEETMQQLDTNAAMPHVENVRTRIEELARHLRRDVEKVDEPKAQALFETTAEVLLGLCKAFEHYGQKSERAWR
jgi:hypothetical protein